MAKQEYKDYFENGSFNYKGYLKMGRLYFGAFVLLLVAIVIFVYFAVISGYNVYLEVKDVIADPIISPLIDQVNGLTILLMSHKQQVLAVVFVAVAVSYIASLLCLNLLKLIGALFIWILTALTVALAILLAYYAQEYTDYAYLLLIAAVVPPVILAFFWKRLKIASRLVNLTADLLMKNKRIFWNGLCFGLLYLILTAGVWGIYIDKFIKLSAYVEGIILNIQTTDFSQDWFVVAMTALYFFLVQISYNYYYGAVVHMAHAYYRGAKEGQLDGFRVANRRLRPLFTYAVFSSIIYTIQWILKQMAKRSKDTERLSKIGIKVVLKGKLMPGLINKKSITQKISNWAIKLLEKLWLLINFFTLPAIIVENRNAPSAIKRSIEYVGSNAVDVFIRKTAIRHVFRFTTVIFIILCAGGGALVGLWATEYFQIDRWTGIVVFSVLFGLFAGAPAWVMTKSLDVVYVSFLYCYLVDEDLKKAGIAEIPSKFFGSTDLRDGKVDKMNRQRYALGVLGVVFAFVAIGVYGYVLYVLLSVDPAIMLLSTPFHNWLETIASYTGYGALGLLLALVFSAMARRKYMSIALVCSILVALFTVLYIDYWRPNIGIDNWDADTLRWFKILISCLVALAVGSWLLGTIVEIYLLTHDFDIIVNQQLVRKMETRTIADDISAETAKQS